MIGWDERFFGTTRCRIVSELRRGQRTVDEVACAVGLTDNAVRPHLAALERDRLTHPEACSLAESFVRELTDLPPRECCQRTTGEPPRCAFELEQAV
jgi:predicted ArsR family transcriptional regulator